MEIQALYLGLRRRGVCGVLEKSSSSPILERHLVYQKIDMLTVQDV